MKAQWLQGLSLWIEGEAACSTLTLLSSATISAAHALTILQALHAAGVDVLAQGPADSLPILHAAAYHDASALVRWLVATAGASLEERDSGSCIPLLVSCHQMTWAAAHALLDCGARVDVQGV